MQYPKSFILRPHSSFSPAFLHNSCPYCKHLQSLPRSQFHNLISQCPIFLKYSLNFPFFSALHFPSSLCQNKAQAVATLELHMKWYAGQHMCCTAIWLPANWRDSTSQSFRYFAVYWGSVRQDFVRGGFWVRQGSMDMCVLGFASKRNLYFDKDCVSSVHWFFPKVLNSCQKLAEVSHAFTVKSRIQDVVVPVTLDRNSWRCFALGLVCLQLEMSGSSSLK